jgi:hypothetical protein
MTGGPHDMPVLEMPVRGTWRVVRSPGHAEFAYDLAAVKGPRSGTLDRSRVWHVLWRLSARDSYSWDRPVHAPIDGSVIRAADGWADRMRLSLVRDLWRLMRAGTPEDRDDLRPFAGNHLILKGDGFYVLLAHLREGSLAVAEGERVSVGEPLARIGNSGASLEPHLHVQLLEDLDDVTAPAAPAFVIRRYEEWAGDGWVSTSHRPLSKGTVVRATGPGDHGGT